VRRRCPRWMTVRSRRRTDPRKSGLNSRFRLARELNYRGCRPEWRDPPGRQNRGGRETHSHSHVRRRRRHRRVGHCHARVGWAGRSSGLPSRTEDADLSTCASSDAAPDRAAVGAVSAGGSCAAVNPIGPASNPIGAAGGAGAAGAAAGGGPSSGADSAGGHDAIAPIGGPGAFFRTWFGTCRSL